MSKFKNKLSEKLSSFIDEIENEIETESLSVLKVDDFKDQKVLAPYIGKKVLFRCHLNGVQVGILKDTDREFAYLFPSRKLWSWQCLKGIALESLCVYGPDSNSSDMKATAIVESSSVRLDDICGSFPLSDEVYKSIMNLKTARS